MRNVHPLKRFVGDKGVQWLWQCQCQGVSDRAGSTLGLRLALSAQFNEFVITLMSEGCSCPGGLDCVGTEGALEFILLRLMLCCCAVIEI